MKSVFNFLGFKSSAVDGDLPLWLHYFPFDFSICDFIIFHWLFPSSLPIVTFPVVTSSILNQKVFSLGVFQGILPKVSELCAMEELLFKDNVIVPRRCKPYRKIIILWRTVSTRRGCTPKRLYLLIYSIYAHHSIYVFWFTASI